VGIFFFFENLCLHNSKVERVVFQLFNCLYQKQLYLKMVLQNYKTNVIWVLEFMILRPFFINCKN